MYEFIAGPRDLLPSPAFKGVHISIYYYLLLFIAGTRQSFYSQTGVDIHLLMLIIPCGTLV